LACQQRSASKSTAELCQQAQGLLDQGMEVSEVVGRDFLQYLAQGDPRGSSAAGKKEKIK
jgi:hypothetical protein